MLIEKKKKTFDDANTRQERWGTDRSAAFREIFEEFNKYCAKNVSPDDYIAIEETLHPPRGGYHSGHTTKINQLNMVWILRVWAVLGILTFIILWHIPESQ